METLGTILRFIFLAPLKLLDTLRLVIVNAVFFGLILLLLVSFAGKDEPDLEVPQGAALLFNPAGTVVERRTIPPLLDRYLRLADADSGEILFQDLLDTLRQAAADKRLGLVVLDTKDLEGLSFSQFRELAKAVEMVRESGKKVISMAGIYDQGDYYLAAHGDEVYLDPMGMILVRGFGVYRLYYKEMLEKLKVDFHVFRTGAYKSAVEPFLRNDMSPDAREATREWLDRLWRYYCDDLAIQRGLDDLAFDELLNNLADRLAAVQGSPARLALEAGLVNGLKTRQEFEDYLADLAGEDGDSYLHVDYGEYQELVTPSYTEAAARDRAQRIAVIVAEGQIVGGEDGPGLIAAEELADLLRRAREMDKVRAVVLRLNSPGGGMMASELIRREVEATSKAGKPVVVSMGAVAASGGYWIAASADRILASPVTLTGSIGVFGVLPTADEALAEVGVYSDGVGTTDMAAGLDVTRELPPDMARAMQLVVEHGYARFLEVVAQGRGRTLAEVHAMAQGRVWDGETALGLGLVDDLGNLEDAVAAAAELAGITDYDALYLEKPGNVLERLLDSLGSWRLGLARVLLPREFALLRQGLEPLRGPLALLLNRPDPAHVYALSPLRPVM